MAMSKRIIFTGGTGKAGRHVVPYLVEHGYQVLNLDLQPLDHPGVHTLITDVSDAGQVFNALTSHFSMAGFANGEGRRPPDAVVHFAAIARNMIKPDAETFRTNVMSTYHVIEAATTLGIRKVLVASSETTYGVCFADWDKDYASFPLDEEYDIDPMDSYGLSKLVNEKTARAFAMRTGADIYALRIGNVIEPHEYGMFPAFIADPPCRIHRRPGSRPDRPARDRKGWPRFPGIQRGERYDHGRSADRGVPRPLRARRTDSPSARSLRSTNLEPQDPRGAWLSGGAQLAAVRERCGTASRSAGPDDLLGLSCRRTVSISSVRQVARRIA
jgi:dTDP-4-dehydrorhamnose reductase